MDIRDYLNEFESLLDNIAHWKSINTDDVKRTQLGRAFVKIEEFSSFNQDKQERQDFVNHCFELIGECELKLTDENYTDYNSRLSLLSDIKFKAQKLFPDIIPENHSLSIKSKIILLDYLGITKMLFDNNFSQKQQVILWSLLLERSSDNTKKALSGVNGKIGVSGAIKDEASLNSVKKIIEELKIPELKKRVETDLASLNKEQEKKG